MPLRWQEGRYARLEIDAHGACVQWPTRGGDATLRRLLPRGGALHKFTAVLDDQQRQQDLVFANI